MCITYTIKHRVSAHRLASYTHVAGKLIFLMVSRALVISFSFINLLNGIIFNLHPITIVSFRVNSPSERSREGNEGREKEGNGHPL